MPRWRVELTPAAGRELRRLRADELLALRGVILALADEHRPPGAAKVRGSDLWRLRVRIDGIPWRVVYQVREGERLVLITRVVRRNVSTYRTSDGFPD